MPFTTKEDRSITDAIGPQAYGDRCFLAYREMVRRWRKSRRWTTAHEIYLDLMAKRRDTPVGDDLAAAELAWQVFFVMEVLPYEEDKKELNGDVE